MPSLPIPSGWERSSDSVEICAACGRPEYRSRMVETMNGNLECDLHDHRNALELSLLLAEAEQERSALEGLDSPDTWPASRDG